MRYFLGIVGILGFCDFVIFLSHCNTLILQYRSLCFQEYWKYSLSSVDVGIIGQTTLKPLMHFYDDFFYLCVLEFILLFIKASAVITYAMLCTRPYVAY